MPARTDSESFEEILEHLRDTRGFDFTAYKRASLTRRLVKRMQMVGATTFDRYFDYLQAHEEEFDALFNTILINVTSFFRDPEVWEHVDSEVVPALIEGHGGSTPIRIWSAGCASGQEAYSMAMLLAERMGLEGLGQRVKIYATDVDNDALTQARKAAYPIRLAADVPPHLFEKYFDTDGATATLNRDLRRVVICGALDLVQDAPISHVDLLMCRNTLMYFNAETQIRILTRFASSLNPNGFLLLGRAEMLFSRSALFNPVDIKQRVFRVNAKVPTRHRAGAPAPTRDAMVNNVPEDFRLRDAAFDAEPAAQIVLDAAGVVIAANIRARHQFGISARDIGRALQDLEVSYRPADLRGALDRALAERHDVTVKDVHWFSGGDTRYFDVVVTPLFDHERQVIGSRISFEDVTRYRLLQSELHASKQELDTAYEELQSTNEELETTNEELQSTVEELETTNEELQSTNEELQTMNDEMRCRSTDLDAVNAFLESVFSSLHSAVVVLDREFRVRIWNEGARELWGARSDEAVGANFLALDIGLPVAQLGKPIKEVLSGSTSLSELTMPATNRRGKTIQCRITLTPLRQTGGPETSGVILKMEGLAEPV
jgi:two-component system CheB/CheR fusion protein